jgi:superfamily II DNA or RNA helicase
LGGVEHQLEFETTSQSLRERKIRAGVGTIQKITQGHDIPPINRGFILTPLAGNRQQFEQLCGRFRRTCEGKKDAIIYYFSDVKIYPQDKKLLIKRYPGYVQEFVDGKFIDK